MCRSIGVVDRGRPGRDPAPGVARATSCSRAFLLLVVATEVGLQRNKLRSGGYASGSVADVEEGVDIAENRAIFRSPGAEIFPVLLFGECSAVRATLEAEGEAQTSQGRSKVNIYKKVDYIYEGAYLAKGDPKRTL